MIDVGKKEESPRTTVVLFVSQVNEMTARQDDLFGCIHGEFLSPTRV